MLYSENLSAADQHKKFVSCDLNPEELSAGEWNLMLTLVSQVLSPESDVNESGDVKAMARVFADNVGALLAAKRATA